MGKAPAVILIARHGARLDAEDESWVKNASAPYDPPLSYGGWTQTRALGARIASILRERDIAINNEEFSNNRRRGSHSEGYNSTQKGFTEQKPAVVFKRRKRKVIIHSSPFLRCIQSSIGISAGMAQYEGNLKKFEAAHERIGAKPKPKSILHTSRSQTLDAAAFDAKYSDPKHEPKPKAPDQEKSTMSPSHADFWKPTLRVDAFLGEWLSPVYYEFIAKPPESKMMVAGAKAELMKAGSPIQGARVIEDVRTPEDDWQNGPPKGPSKRGPSVSFRLDDLANALPSADNSTERKDYGARKSAFHARHKSVSNGYTPPALTYAISTTEGIPPGFVAHARDACIRLDFQWDSMHEPQLWGDGGEYGEEWPALHRRFRKGLMEMITWYKQQDPYYDPQAPNDVSPPDATQDEDEETIIVIVTHGAGCNALIGALTNQPVLLDVGMASMTMAVHQGPHTSTNPKRSSVTSRRRSSVDISQSEEYVMKYTASSEHLRAGADPLKIPQLQSPYLSAIPEGSLHGASSTSASDGTITPELEKPNFAMNAALGSMRRSRATTLGSNRIMSGDSSRSSTGLWGPFASRNATPSAPTKTATLSEPSETLPSREHSPSGDEPAISPMKTDSAEEKELAALQENLAAPVPKAAPKPTTQRTMGGGGGLWGSAPPRKEPARRWTLVDQR